MRSLMMTRADCFAAAFCLAGKKTRGRGFLVRRHPDGAGEVDAPRRRQPDETGQELWKKLSVAGFTLTINAEGIIDPGVQHQGCRLSGADRVLRPGSTAICRAAGPHAIQSRDLVKSPTPEWTAGDVFDDRQESSNGRNDLWPDFGLGSDSYTHATAQVDGVGLPGANWKSTHHVGEPAECTI